MFFFIKKNYCIFEEQKGNQAWLYIFFLARSWNIPFFISTNIVRFFLKKKNLYVMHVPTCIHRIASLHLIAPTCMQPKCINLLVQPSYRVDIPNGNSRSDVQFSETYCCESGTSGSNGKRLGLRSSAGCLVAAKTTLWEPHLVLVWNTRIFRIIVLIFQIYP